MKFNRVVVTGIGAITPVGNNVATFWKNLTDGVSGADKITQFDTTQFRTKFACEVKNYRCIVYIRIWWCSNVSGRIVSVFSKWEKSKIFQSVFCAAHFTRYSWWWNFH